MNRGFFVLFGLLALVCISPAYAQVSDVYVLDLTLTNQNPYPVEPGENVNIAVSYTHLTLPTKA